MQKTFFYVDRLQIEILVIAISLSSCAVAPPDYMPILYTVVGVAIVCSEFVGSGLEAFADLLNGPGNASGRAPRLL